ncbi:hypothetical protein CLOM_g676 [Closterium sp. NIES-68]|nr:hypothetical protein CLOM_g676 [Closterium sp. NIES-68]GJP69410.1 hypothetical protein CLOP_g340 [Closterium sp. NIES-67]
MIRRILAVVLQLLLVLLLLPCCCFHRATGTFGSQPDRSVSNTVYIVSLRSAPPVLAYRGGFAGFPATAPPPPSPRLASAAQSAFSALQSAADRVRGALGGRIRKEWERQRGKWRGKGKALVRSAKARQFAAFLKRQQRNVAASAGVPPARILHSYRYLSNGFAARLSPAQVRRLQRHPAVARVRASVRLYPATTHSPTFLKLPASLWNASRGTWGERSAGAAGVAEGAASRGEGVVIGVIDSGIWPEHPSFASQPGAPSPTAPSTFAGACETTGDFEACSGKVVGARAIRAAFEAEGGSVDLTVDYLSPRDSFNHGSWCAGAAAGNSGVDITAKTGQLIGAASGMAPGALLSIYKVLWRSSSQAASAPLADVKAAVEQAILDGVDVISISLAGLYDYTDYFTDVSYLNALRAGVVMVMAAGNDGRPPTAWSSWRTLSNFSPFYLTVGASSIGRQFSAAVTMGNRKSLVGASMGGDERTAAGLPLVDGLTARIGGTYEGKYCFEEGLDPAKIAGKLVVCVRGTAYIWQKVQEVSRCGGLGMILINDPKGDSNLYDNIPSPVPVLHLTAKDGAALLTYMKKTRNATASIPGAFTIRQLPGHPVIASFSSSGPLADPADSPMHPYPTNDILKPDLVAPGLSLWSAAAGSLENAGVVTFGLLSGTSMATPHVAGVAALLVQRNPTWSPAQVMSAMLTSATTTNDAGKPIKLESGATATPWEMGAGMINPPGMLDPGLTYNMDAQDLLNFLAGQDHGLTQSLFRNYTLSPTSPANLNRPLISVSRIAKTATVSRTVTNVASAASNYTAKVVVPSGVKVTVKPATFAIGIGESVTFNVTFTVTKQSSKFSYGSLTWVDKLGHAVRSVLAVQPLRR